MADDELLTLADAAPIAGLSASQLRTLAGAGRIPGAVLRESEGARGRWYVPRAWAEAKGKGKADPPTMRQQVEDLARAEPDLSRAEIARRVGCTPGYVSRLLGPLEGATGDASADARPKPIPNAERREAPAGLTRPKPFSIPDLSKASIYRVENMPGYFYVLVDGLFYRVPDDRKWSPALGGRLEKPRGAKQVSTRDEERARRLLAGQ